MKYDVTGQSQRIGSHSLVDPTNHMLPDSRNYSGSWPLRRRVTVDTGVAAKHQPTSFVSVWLRRRILAARGQPVCPRMPHAVAVFFAIGLTNLFHAQVSAAFTIDATLPRSRVEVGVYYETLCPYCRAFVVEQLLPAYKKAPERISLKLVPYGNAETDETPEGYSFTCQHGPKECEANKIHACAIDIVRNQCSALRLVECMIRNEGDPEEAGEQCCSELGIRWKPILRCARGSRGSRLLKRNGDVTRALRPEIEGVPTVTLDGYQKNETAYREDLWGEICNVLKGRKPRDCPMLNDIPLAYDED